MSNRLLKLLPVLLAFVLICSVSVFAVFADESVADESVVDESVADESAAEESATEESTADESAAETSGDESEAETSGDKSEAETSATTSSTTSATTSTTSKDDHAGHDHGEETSGGLSARTWQLIITAAVVVILVAVLFILAKTNTKFGQKIANFFKNYKSELGKIVWMPKNDLVKSTSIVLLVLVAACALIGLLDLAFSSVLNLLSSIG